jgi:hypothetical protein
MNDKETTQDTGMARGISVPTGHILCGLGLGFQKRIERFRKIEKRGQRAGIRRRGRKISMEMKAGCPFPNSPLDFGSGILRPGQDVVSRGKRGFYPVFLLLPR